MRPEVAAEISRKLTNQAVAMRAVMAIREAEPTIEALFAAVPPHSAFFWVDSNGISFGCSIFAASIMFDSEIAEILESIEDIFDQEFTSTVAAAGDVEYLLAVPGFHVRITALLAEQGTCRKAIRSYRMTTTYKSVEVEEAVPVYGVVCGEEATA